MEERVETKLRSKESKEPEYTVKLTGYNPEEEMKQRQIEDMVRLQKTYTYGRQGPDYLALGLVLLVVLGIVGLVALLK